MSSLSVAEFTSLNSSSEILQASGGNGVKAPKSSFFNVFLDHLPNTKTSFAEQARALHDERKLVLSQLLEKLRTESDARRQELLSKLMKSKEDEKPYDIAGKCLEIARRIMRGEAVSAEEMRFLSRYFPELLFQALLLRQEEINLEENEGFSFEEEAQVLTPA